jgi:hypothetical protein
VTWWAWILVLALPVGYLRLVAHELSHAVMTLALGGRVYWRRFRPWPHRDGGRWFWGRMYREDLPGWDDDLLISLAPLGRASVGALAWIAPAIAWAPLWICVFWEVTDVIHWWVGWFRSPTSDGGKVREIFQAKRAARASRIVQAVKQKRDTEGVCSACGKPTRGQLVDPEERCACD